MLSGLVPLSHVILLELIIPYVGIQGNRTLSTAPPARRATFTLYPGTAACGFGRLPSARMIVIIPGHDKDNGHAPGFGCLEQVRGVEPRFSPWKGETLAVMLHLRASPLN